MWGRKDCLFFAVTVLSMIHILYVILTMAFKMECVYYGSPTNKHLCCNILKFWVFRSRLTLTSDPLKESYSQNGQVVEMFWELLPYRAWQIRGFPRLCVGHPKRGVCGPGDGLPAEDPLRKSLLQVYWKWPIELYYSLARFGMDRTHKWKIRSII